MEYTEKPIILYDGKCNFCNSSINFIIRHDKNAYFSFAPLQSSIGKELLNKFQIELGREDSVVLVEKGRCYLRSDASMQIARHLDGLLKVCYYILLIIPRFIRDYFYNVIARNRYKWFGKNEECIIPSAEIKNRFIE